MQRITALLPTIIIMAALSPLAQADNVANCEVVVVEEIKDKSLDGHLQLTAFHDGVDFIKSVYDEEEGHLKSINENPIQAVLCQRPNIIPSLSDFPIIATGIPFSLSQNFDANDSGLMTIYFKDGEFRYLHNGPELNEALEAKLHDRMKAFNLQPHDLAEREARAKADSLSDDDTKEADLETDLEAELESDLDLGAEPQTLTQSDISHDHTSQTPVEDRRLNGDQSGDTSLSQSQTQDESENTLPKSDPESDARHDGEDDRGNSEETDTAKAEIGKSDTSEKEDTEKEDAEEDKK